MQIRWCRGGRKRDLGNGTRNKIKHNNNYVKVQGKMNSNERISQRYKTKKETEHRE